MNETTKNTLVSTIYATVSTVTADGQPWATPVHFAHDENNIYWLSNENAIHSMNIDRDSRVFITIFDSRQVAETLADRGAMYVATHAMKLTGDAAIAARDVYADRFSDDNNRKLSEWSVYCAPIGQLDEIKSRGSLLYYRHDEEVDA